MNTEEILDELETARDRLSQAIVILNGKTGKERTAPRSRRRRPLSAAAKRRISDGMKRRWAERKRVAKAVEK